MDVDIESPVLGTREKTTDHILLTKIIGGYHRGKVFYLKWNDTSKKWTTKKIRTLGPTASIMSR